MSKGGVPEQDAHFFAEGLRRGGALVIVYAKNDEEARRAEGVMRRDGALDIRQRRDEWMRRGWKGRFEPEERKVPADLDLAAVCVYEVVIELPAQYTGPDRRIRAQPFSGANRRAA